MSVKTRITPNPIKNKWVNLITDAMLLADGNRREAAKLLGWTEKTVHNEINRSGLLRARWGGDSRPIDVDQPSTETDVVDRKPVKDEPIDPVIQEKRKALLIAAANRDFKKGLGQMGLTEQELVYAVASQKFGEKQKRSSYEMINGNAPINHIKMQTRLREMEEALGQAHQWLRENPGVSEERSEKIKEIKVFYTAYRDIQEQCRRNQETCNKGLMGLAILRLKEEKANTKTSKMGFAPINIGSSQVTMETDTVNVNGNGEDSDTVPEETGANVPESSEVAP